MKKSKPRQLLFAFAESSQEDDEEKGADESVSEPASVQIANDSQRLGSMPPAEDCTRSLLERAACEENLLVALERVARNKGAPGVDRVTVKEVVANAQTLIPKLHDALLSETYVPGDIRRVWIPKPGGGQRGLGIPNVIDRVVQMAVLQTLEPIYEPTFHNSSHGFRPGRGAQTALADAARHVTKGLRFTVDLDLEKFFDRVHHQRLLDRLAQRVKDGRILRLVRLMLKAKVVFPDGVREALSEGTPQGGPLSPLLSNIVLDELDQELERRGLHFVRYADDCNVYVGSERAGRRVMASIRRFIENRLRLKVNEKKSAVSPAGKRHFLGFRIGATAGGKIFVRLSDRSKERLKDKVRELTPRNLGSSIDTCLRRLNAYVRGWMGYFRLCTSGERRVFRHVDAHIRRRLRAILIKQKKRARFLYRHLTKRGVGRGSAQRTAYSRRGPWWQSASGGMHRGYPNAWFEERLSSLDVLWRTTRYDWRPFWATRPEEPYVRSTSPVL